CCFKMRLQHQCVLLIVTMDINQGISGRNGPATVLFIAQQRTEAGGIVEAIRTEPIDTAIPRDQRSAVKVAQKCVVFDVFGHLGFLLIEKTSSMNSHRSRPRTRISSSAPV